MTDDGFGQVVEAIYAAAVDQDRWPDAMELIAQEVGGRGTLLGIDTGGAPRFLSVTGYDQAAIDTFATDYADKSYVWSLLPSSSAGDLIHDRRVLSPDRRRRDPFANEWATRHDTADCVVLPLVKHPDISAVAVVARSLRRGAFDAPELTSLKRLAPHLQRAIAVNSRLRHSAQQADLAINILDKLRDGIVLVTADGVVTYCNKAAETLFRDRSAGLSIVQSRVVCHRTGDAGLLRRSIAAAAGLDGNGPRTGGAVSIERDGHLWPLTVYCLPITQRQRCGLEQQPAVLLLLTDTARSIELSPSTLGQLFHLTSAEARLALHLARGQTLAGAAETMGVARSTVASQLHTIFQKTCTSRQSELVRLLHTLPQLDLGDMGGALLA
jgi:DNA-binding CsgD family transcriptional regulator/PAS domain-containing protein